MLVHVPGCDRPYVPGDRVDWSAPVVFGVPELLSPQECTALRARIDELGPAPAPITTSAGFVMRPDIRNNTRVIFDDRALAADLFARLTGAVPERLFGRAPCGVNERFRCYVYDPGQRFAPHYDGSFRRNEQEESELTFLVYLNDDLRGGHTAFLDFDVSIAPKTGAALLFQHRVLHEGCVIESGRKYVLRSDVMYADPAP
ncbi:MAG: 2OG-Fe(II) oxygenase [Kofleriaceae bacterium]